MHIPDGFLNTTTVATTCAVSAVFVGVAVKMTNRKLGEKQVPLMGVMAAFIFAAQMLNFPIAGGTSGHLIGAVLAAILLGPWAAVLVMTSVLIIQCVVFQDGGVLALGANVLNMGIVAPFLGYYCYRAIIAVTGESRRSKLAGCFVGCWVSVVGASAVCAVELWASGTSPLSVALSAMIGWHVLIGIGEGLIGSTVLGAVLATRSDILELQEA
jgi:cobalt/nickel transport system permease protein